MCICCFDHDTVIEVIHRAQRQGRPLSDHEVVLVTQRLRHDKQRGIRSVQDAGPTTIPVECRT